MRIIKQISSLEKIRIDELPPSCEVLKKTALKGERFSYQIAVCHKKHIPTVSLPCRRIG